MTTEPYPIPDTLLRAHGWARRQPWLARFTLANRLLLAMAFLPTGLVKATGQRFTTLPASDPVGFFFEAMYQTGPYWIFIGLIQIVASILLLIPATATVGALLFLPIAISIFLITWGIGFTGTVYVTAGMLLSAIYLVCWDGDRVWRAATGVLGRRPGPSLLNGAHPLERVGWTLGAIAGLGVIFGVRGFLSGAWIGRSLLLGAFSAGVVLVGFGLSAWSSRSPEP